MDTLDIALRLGTATLVGVVLGLNRDLHGKATGVRTLGLVCLGSALAVLSVHAVNDTDASRSPRPDQSDQGAPDQSAKTAHREGGISRSQVHAPSVLCATGRTLLRADALS